MFDRFFSGLQRIGRSFMLPIAILPVAGLFLGIGESLTNTAMIEAYNLQGILGDGTFLNILFTIFQKAGNIVFSNLPIIFAVGVAIGMSKKEKAVAALAAVIAFFIMHQSISILLEINGQIVDGQVADFVTDGTISSVCGILSLELGVFGGIIVGLGVAFLHNHFYKIQLPEVLSFFSGTHFVPIICSIVYLFVGVLLYFLWPNIQSWIYTFSDIIQKSGYLGTLLFGLIKRMLLPFGLHHVFYLPFWQTGLGGSMMIGGELIQGGQNIFFAQLASPDVVQFSSDATRFFSGEFIFMIFGLPGAALAMYRCADPKKKKRVGGLLLSAAVTSMLTGITEPIEFSFLFAAPILFVVHVVLAGSAYMIAHILNVAVGLTFSGGVIDLFLFGILQGNAKTNWLWIPIVGIIYFFLYYFIFTFLIKKFNLKTPGREDDEVKLYTKKDYLEQKDEKKKTERETILGVDDLSSDIAEGLGGAKNILDVDCCTSRLRATLADVELVDEEKIKQTGSARIFKRGKGIQITYGPQVLIIKSNLEDYLEKMSQIDS
ncbi:PTS transporter subunit EIIC [Breznakia pachnodae]|uniref:PTS system D-glucosamine-specific IIC component n=1 Tax=Breznakia pachnodae TaxID=265178 RepID=A0ABU0E3M4_9FIRM|nr:PTS transporter subunit EIIC [Breznakia pachnodae]MDQ0361410.1 PTS system D-glucosamine-specific IIC component [Breznakia pachnodae]